MSRHYPHTKSPTSTLIKLAIYSCNLMCNNASCDPLAKFSLELMCNNATHDLAFKFQKLPSSNLALTCSKGHVLQKRDLKWIFNCGSTYTVSFDANDFDSIENSKNSLFQTANGECVEVRGASTINIFAKLVS